MNLKNRLFHLNLSFRLYPMILKILMSHYFHLFQMNLSFR
jgi:hypothetical protein